MTTVFIDPSKFMYFWPISKVRKQATNREVEKVFSTSYLFRFLRNLVCLTSTMENLPPNVFMTVRLLYYDNGEFIVQ